VFLSEYSQLCNADPDNPDNVLPLAYTPPPMIFRKRCPRSILALIGYLLCLLATRSALGFDKSAPGGPTRGHIDGIGFDGNQFYVSGWACQLGSRNAIDVRVYAERGTNNVPRQTLVAADVANLGSEPAVDQACHDQGGKHRFHIQLSNQALVAYRETKLYVQGVVTDGDDAPIDGSGTIQFPNPPLSGTYTTSRRHPRVFTSQAELNALVTRINSPNSFSTQKFVRLTSLVKADIAAKVDWDAAYSGCDIDIYLHTFSIEETRGYSAEVRSQDRIRSELKMNSSGSPPAGAALVASRLALYAALLKAGASAPAGAPTIDQATALARRILVAWASRGFRDAQGGLVQYPSQFCEGDGRISPTSQSAVGLQISRGVIYSVNAQDLLQSLGVLSAKEESQLNAFHSAMFDLILRGLNYRFGLIRMPCDRYSNHVASQLTGLLATARLLDDKKKFDATLYGVDSSIPVELPWTVYFNRAIYGQPDTPNACFQNSGQDGLTSKPFFQTSIVAPGEIDDRFRNANPLQGIGYSSATLEHLFAAAEIMRLAGLDTYSYRGIRQQSIELAAEYYACYAKYAGFKKSITANNARSCPNYEQYVGKIVNDVEPSILMGASRFPRNTAITEAEPRAKAESLRDTIVDTIRFGRWTN
jgi:hypothetical protein